MANEKKWFAVPIYEVRKQIIYIEAEDAIHAQELVMDGEKGINEVDENGNFITEFVECLDSSEWPEPFETGPYTPPSKWANNEVQFARLISELVANVDNLEAKLVAESMDLSEDELLSLYERAFATWEKAKDFS